jgi:hypothetical protein
VGLVIAANALLSPTKNVVQVNITNGAGLALGTLTLQATLAATTTVVATGTYPSPSKGDLSVTLTFTGPVQGVGNLVAILPFTDPSGGQAEVRSTAVPVELDSQGPALQSLSALDAADTVGGWTPRVAGQTLTVAAAYSEDTTGSGLDVATLTIDGCLTPACSFAGVLGAVSQGAGAFRFTVPRTLQAAGSEEKIPFTVKARDKAGNETVSAGALQIDDAPPLIGAGFTLVTAGVSGEDGNTWFTGGAHGKDVEVAVPIGDRGAGLLASSLVLTLATADISPGATSTVQGFLPSTSDGTVHFKIPTGVVAGREGRLHFTVAAQDRLGHSIASAQTDARAIWVDDVPPQVTVSVADYTALSPAWGAVCGQADLVGVSGPFSCGRGPSNGPTHALRDDLVPVKFTVTDCGSGVGGSGGYWQLDSGGQLSTLANASLQTAVTAGSCANGSANKTHAFLASVDLAAAAPLLAPPDLDGTSVTTLVTGGADKTGNAARSPGAPNLTTGHILVRHWRWQAQLGGQPSGAPALLFAGSPSTASAVRPLVVPLKATGAAASPPHALEVFDATGKLTPLSLKDGTADVTPIADVVAGSERSLWFGAESACVSGLGSCSRLWAAAQVAGSFSSGPCPLDTGTLGALALRINGTLTSDQAVSATTAAPVTEQAALWQATFSSNQVGCKSTASAAPNSGVPLLPFSGVAIGGDTAYFSHAQGFLSASLNGGGTGFGSGIPFVDAGGALVLPAAPSLTPASPRPTPFFGAQDEADAPSLRKLRRASPSSASGGGCGGNCWAPTQGFNESALAAAISHTPVHDASTLFVVDDAGALLAFDQATGAAVGPTGGVAAADSSGTPAPQPVSPPVLLGSAALSPRPALVVQSDGLVNYVIPGNNSAAWQVQVRPFGSGRPLAPLVDVRGTGGVAYVVDGGCPPAGGACGSGWVWAVQIDSPPLAASSTAWPRPSRDTCNSRHLEAACP